MCIRDRLDTAGALEGAGLSAYVYTQLSDVEEECNGILTYDRRVNKLKEDGDECGSAETVSHTHLTNTNQDVMGDIAMVLHPSRRERPRARPSRSAGRSSAPAPTLSLIHIS